MQKITIYCDSCGSEIRSLIDQKEVGNWIQEHAKIIKAGEDTPDLCFKCQLKMQKEEQSAESDDERISRE